MKYKVIRQHEFQTGHRVYGHEGQCQYLHGHSYRAHLYCEEINNELDDLGRVIDFGVIKETLCTWIDRTFDHRFLVWDKDPIGGALTLLDPMVNIVPFNPTAENIAAFILKEGCFLLKSKNIKVTKVVIEETGKCRAEATL